MRCVVSCGSTSFPWRVFFFGALLCGSMIHSIQEDGCDKGAHQSYLGTVRNTRVVPNCQIRVGTTRRLVYRQALLARLAGLVSADELSAEEDVTE